MDDKEAFGGWHHCGEIYSTRICCPEYVEAVIASLPHASLWTYHTTCERLGRATRRFWFTESFLFVTGSCMRRRTTMTVRVVRLHTLWKSSITLR
jgi:hypothetical protein